MTVYAYQDFEEPRTACLRSQKMVLSQQNWKTNHLSAQKEITDGLNKTIPNRMGNAEEDFNSMLMSYAPQKIPSPADTSSFRFGDVIDSINPLHHMPLVGTAYRQLTGDDLHPMAGIIGGGLYGGAVGAIAGTMNAVSQIQTGKTVEGHVLSLIL